MSQAAANAYFLNENNAATSISAVLNEGRPAFLIGSDSRSHLLIEEAEAAHALVIMRQNACFIQPRFAHAVVAVNGKRISGPTCLLPGDVVQIAGRSLRFGQDDAAPLNEGLKPLNFVMAKPQAAAPTISEPALVRPASTLATPAPALATPAPAATSVYYPQQAADKPNVAGIMVGVVSVLAVVGVLAFAMITGAGAPAGAAIRASAPPVDYAYNDGKATLVMFTAAWCQFCAQQKPIVTSLEKDYSGSMYVHYVDIDDSANRTLVNRYGARAVPMIVILDDMGKVVATFRGVSSADTLSAAINRALDESARTPNRTLDET